MVGSISHWSWAICCFYNAFVQFKPNLWDCRTFADWTEQVGINWLLAPTVGCFYLGYQLCFYLGARLAFAIQEGITNQQDAGKLPDDTVMNKHWKIPNMQYVFHALQDVKLLRKVIKFSLPLGVSHFLTYGQVRKRQWKCTCTKHLNFWRCPLVYQM